MNDPFFSVVIPAYNRAALLPDTIKHMLAQDFDRYEILLVDDGSTDNTPDVIKELVHPKLKYYFKENAERAAARNYGANKAKGEYIIFFDSDDLATPHLLSDAKSMIELHDNPEFVSLSYEMRTPEGKVIRKPPKIENNANEVLVNGNFLSCSGTFVRRDIALEYPFNEDRALSGSEDLELWMRLAARYKLYYSNKLSHIVLNHDERSVLTMPKEPLVKRKELMLKYAFADKEVMKMYGDFYNKMYADTVTYIALHLALTKKYRLSALGYLFKSLFIYPPAFFTRRTLAIFKHLI